MDQLLIDLTTHVKKKKNLKLATHFVKDLNLENIDISKYINFDEKTYKRNKVLENEHISIMILCWAPGQKSPIHNHPNQGCIMKIIKGTLEEELFNINNMDSTINIHTKNKVTYIDNTEFIHKISNNSKKNVISLHCYSPSGFKATIYN